MGKNFKKEHSEEAPKRIRLMKTLFMVEIIAWNVLREYQSIMKKECKNGKECTLKSPISPSS